MEKKAPKFIQFFVVAIILFAIFFFWLTRNSNKKMAAKIGSHQFQLETARTQEERNLGLGGKKNLCQDCAMLFVFPSPSDYSFWMKDMDFDLDIIWIYGGKIAYIAKDVSHDFPEKIIDPRLNADQVLEINSGLSDKYNFKVGDEVKIH